MHSPSLDDLITEIDRWFADTIQRGAIAREVACYNQAYAAQADLKDRIALMITGKPISMPAPPAKEPESETATAADKGAAGEPKSKSAT